MYLQVWKKFTSNDGFDEWGMAWTVNQGEL